MVITATDHLTAYSARSGRPKQNPYVLALRGEPMSEGQFKREEAEHLAAAIASIDPDDPESYFSRVDKLLKERKALTFQKAQTERLTILNNLSGSLEPGRLTLLLGPPSCGKTTFLRALAGRLPENKYTGSIEYNGYKLSEFVPARTATFVAQEDTHIPNLTARETVKFAYDVQDNQSTSMFKASTPQNIKSASVEVKPLEKVVPDNGKLVLHNLNEEDLERLTRDALDGPGRIDTLMHLFGLLRCKDTWAGNRQTRGISGGERKRLSTVELLTGGQRVLILDEISTGLDAATLFEIIKWLRAMCHHLQMTVIVSLLQPPPETFALFDDLMIMNEGTIVYHDTIPDAVPFMETLGFQLPPRKDVPSFLQEVTTVRGQIAYASPAMRRERGMPNAVSEVDDIELSQMDPFMSLSEMAAQGAKLRANSPKDLAPGLMNGPGEGALMPHSEKVAMPWVQQLKLLLKRQVTLFVRDPVLVRARMMQSLVMGLIIGGLWFNLGTDLDDTRTYMSAIFMTVLFFSFGGMPQLAMALQNRTVWFKQRESNLYSATAYAWCMSLVQLPLSIVEAVIFVTITYFMIGFSTDGAQYYFLFLATCVSVSMAITSLFRLLGCAFSSQTAAQGVGGFFLLLLIVNSGFIIVRSSIPPWVICFYWISPFAYSIRGLVINEFTSPRWDRPLPFGEKSMGDTALESLDFYTDRMWIGIGIAFNLAMFIIFTNLAALCLAWLKPPRKPVTIRLKEELKASLQEARKAKEEAHTMLTQGNTGNTAPQSKVTQGSSRKSGLDVGSSLKFTPIHVCWRDLSYYVPVAKGLTGAAALNIMPADAEEDIAGKKRLLNNITGYAEPGVLIALMGGSGAGKTTLMDVLAGRKNQGVIKGDLMINGHPKVQDTWARVVGYVEQVDIHSGGLTVEESLQFSAGLRLTPDVDERTRAAYILEVLLVTELIDIKGALVGDAGETGLSVEQRRRLSIGVELVANPSVVFMDEPTSGLDARSAAAVIEAVRNVAGNGRTVMVTIHQPSIEIFEAFDRLVLLAMGGEPIFCGDLGTHSKSLVEYFEGIPGVPALPDKYNPATWMLEVSGGAAKMYMAAASTQDFPAVYRSSALHKDNTTRVDELITQGAASHKPLSLATRYAVPFAQQTKMVTWKMSIIYWRFPSYTVSRIFVSILTALVFGATWWDEGTIENEPASFKDVQNIIGNLYSSLSFLGMANLLAGVPAFIAERTVMYRERASSMYAVLPFGIATGLVEIPYLLMQSIIFVPLIYFSVGFRLDVEAFFLFVVIFTESIALYTFMGQLFAYLAPTAAVATVLGGVNHFLWNIFNGFLVPSPLMAAGWRWLNYISATTYVIYSLAASQLGDNKKKIALPGFSDYPGCSETNLDACPTVKEFVDEYFGYRYGFRWYCALILLGFVFFFRVAAMVVLKVVNHERR